MKAIKNNFGHGYSEAGEYIETETNINEFLKKDKSKIYLDLSKCTEGEQIKVIALLPEPTRSNDYNIYDDHIYLMYDENDKDWWVASNFPKWHLEKRTELTYPEFIKLFEGGESKEVLQVENNGWIKIESENDLPKEKGDYWVVWLGKVAISYWHEESNIYADLPKQKRDWMEVVSYYQSIPKPEPPKF